MTLLVVVDVCRVKLTSLPWSDKERHLWIVCTQTDRSEEVEAAIQLSLFCSQM